MSECSAPTSLKVLRPYISQIEFQESLNINQDVLCLNRDQDVLCWRQKIKPKLFLRHDLICTENGIRKRVTKAFWFKSNSRSNKFYMKYKKRLGVVSSNLETGQTLPNRIHITW